MKLFFVIVLFLLTGSKAFSQDKLPTADEIRRYIAGGVYSLKILPTPVAKIENKYVINGSDSIKIRLYFPDTVSKSLPIVYQVHGGALVAGDLDTHDNICRFLCTNTSSIIVAIDYRRPPEFPYPASINDCITVLSWIEKTAKTWHGDVNKLTLLGDSGGGLLLTSLLVREQGKIAINKVVLINPAVHLRDAEDQYSKHIANMYLNGKSADDSLASPVMATDISYSPPTLIITCEKDELKPHGVEWYNKLKKANVTAILIDIPNKDHLGVLWAACHPDAKQAIDETIKFITNAK